MVQHLCAATHAASHAELAAELGGMQNAEMQQQVARYFASPEFQAGADGAFDKGWRRLFAPYWREAMHGAVDRRAVVSPSGEKYMEMWSAVPGVPQPCNPALTCCRCRYKQGQVS